MFLKWFGVSERFWRHVFIPTHTSTFLETEMEALPACVLEVMNDIVPIGDGAPPRMATWETDASSVFDKMSEGITIRTGANVDSVQFVCNDSDRVTVIVLDEEDRVEEYDHVIFACSAPSILEALHSRLDHDAKLRMEPAINRRQVWQPSSLWERLAHMLEKMALRRTM
jgi:hypothetical protein